MYKEKYGHYQNHPFSFITYLSRTRPERKQVIFLVIPDRLLPGFFITDSHAPTAGKIMMLSLGVIATLINWFYDYLVLHFSPDNIEVRLYR